MMILNGYEIRQNTKRNGVQWEVLDASGRVVKLAISIGHACKAAEALPMGEVPDDSPAGDMEECEYPDYPQEPWVAPDTLEIPAHSGDPRTPLGDGDNR